MRRTGSTSGKRTAEGANAAAEADQLEALQAEVAELRKEVQTAERVVKQSEVT